MVKADEIKNKKEKQKKKTKTMETTNLLKNIKRTWCELGCSMRKHFRKTSINLAMFLIIKSRPFIYINLLSICI